MHSSVIIIAIVHDNFYKDKTDLLKTGKTR